MNKPSFFRLIIMVALTGLMAASCNQPARSEGPEEVQQVLPGKVNPLDVDSFRDLVWDYHASPTQMVYKGSKPCVIDFYADWCRPCRVASPIMEELAAKYKDEIVFYKVNTDDNKELAMLFKVNTIPAFLHIPMQGEPRFQYGIMPTPDLTRELFDAKIREYIYGEEPDTTRFKLK